VKIHNRKMAFWLDNVVGMPYNGDTTKVVNKNK
jgi:hypothetical protein